MADVYLPMMKAAALISAGQLRLFEALRNGPRSLPSLAAAIGASEVGTGHLADFLAAAGYLTQSDAGFANAPHTTRWFTGQDGVDYNAGLLWSAEAWSLISNLSAAVRKGAPEKTLWASMQDLPHWGPLFSNYMHAFAAHLSPDLLSKVLLPAGARRLLDLGGSHGLHSVAFCRKYPGLHAVIVDYPSALTHTQHTLDEAGMRERISLRPGSVLDGDWGDAPYDAVLCLSVAHNQTADDNRRLFSNIGKAVRPGGLLLIHEYLTGMPHDLYDAAFRLTLLTETATRTYSHDEISAWVMAAGFQAPNRLDLDPIEKGSLLTAIRG